MIVIAVVVGIAVAISLAGWVPLIRDALRTDHVLPGPPVRAAAQIVAAQLAAGQAVVGQFAAGQAEATVGRGFAGEPEPDTVTA